MTKTASQDPVTLALLRGRRPHRTLALPPGISDVSEYIPDPVVQPGDFKLPHMAANDPAIMGPDLMAALLDGETSARQLSNALGRTPTAISNHPMNVSEYDYEDLGPIGQLWAVLQTLYAMGTYDATGPYAASSGTATITNIAMALGVCIDWSVAHDESRPFTMNITTDEFVGIEYLLGAGATTYSSTREVNRSLSVYIPQGCMGGRLFLPFGSTQATAMRAGRATIGVSKAAQSGTTLERTAGTATVVIAGVPSALTSFDFTVTMLTAFKPETAQFAKLIGLA